MPAPRPATVFVLATFVLAATLLADVLYVTAGSDSSTSTRFEATSGRAVATTSMVVLRGDRLLVHPDLPDMAADGRYASYDLFVAAGGSAEEAAYSGVPSKVYAQVRGLKPGVCCPSAEILVVRPDGPEGMDREAARAGGPANGAFLDVVYVFHYAPGRAPSDVEAINAESSALRSMFPRMGPGAGPLVVPAGVARVQPALYATEVLASLACVVALGLFARQLRRGVASDAGATGTEALLGLHRAAGAYLEGFRDLLLVSIGGALVAILVLLFLIAWPIVAAVQAALLTPLARGFLFVCLLLVEVAIVGAWLYMVVDVQRALRRWRARAAAPVLDL